MHHAWRRRSFEGRQGFIVAAAARRLGADASLRPGEIVRPLLALTVLSASLPLALGAAPAYEGSWNDVAGARSIEALAQIADATAWDVMTVDGRGYWCDDGTGFYSGSAETTQPLVNVAPAACGGALLDGRWRLWWDEVWVAQTPAPVRTHGDFVLASA